MNAASRTTVSMVFGRSVRAGSEARYEDWLSGIAGAAARSSGNRGTTLLRPIEGGSEFVAITRFESEASLHAWLRSAEREEWMERLPTGDVRREFQSLHSGAVPWIDRADDERAAPPRSKMAVLVLLGLYPLLLVLDLVLGPLLSDLPRPAALLISLVVSVSLMVGVVLPWLTRLFDAWLHPSTARATPVTGASDGPG